MFQGFQRDHTSIHTQSRHTPGKPQSLWNYRRKFQHWEASAQSLRHSLAQTSCDLSSGLVSCRRHWTTKAKCKRKVHGALLRILDDVSCACAYKALVQCLRQLTKPRMRRSLAHPSCYFLRMRLWLIKKKMCECARACNKHSEAVVQCLRQLTKPLMRHSLAHTCNEGVRAHWRVKKL